VTCHAIELRTFGLQKTIKRLGLRDYAYDSSVQTALSGTLSEIVGKPEPVSDWQACHRSAPRNTEIRDRVWATNTNHCWKRSSQNLEIKEAPHKDCQNQAGTYLISDLT
jgi:hypothetical protein